MSILRYTHQSYSTGTTSMTEVIEEARQLN